MESADPVAGPTSHKEPEHVSSPSAFLSYLSQVIARYFMKRHARVGDVQAITAKESLSMNPSKGAKKKE